nr:DNA mismatch repair endonuclease MutL [candidate division Zixibacteria bacterium]
MRSDREQMDKRWIRPLPERLINKIAAGEVIERPAAVLKELVENSFDALAEMVEVIIEKSGTKLITVIDNGCGIDADQVEIAFARHATSKISNFDDLERLGSFGFRGEALPSIGSVSKLRMVTRTRDSELGTEIIIEGGVIQSRKPTAAPFGTKIEVHDLFFNTPARRKFLKTETTEARYLTRNAVALALCEPKVSFSYTLNGRKIFQLDETYDRLETRVRHVLLGSNRDKLVDIGSETELMAIRGFLSYPDNVRQNQYSLYFFVNNRYIRSQTLLHAVTAGYKELLPRGNYPIGAVFLDVDPVMVDVNVHPTKAEVRLSDERRVHDLLYQAVKRAVFKSTGINMPRVEVGGLPADGTMTAVEAIRKARAFVPNTSGTIDRSMMRELYAHREIRTDIEERADEAPDISDRELSDQSEISGKDEDFDFGGVLYLGSLSNLYLIFRDGPRLLIMDQHTAHERVLYEENLRFMGAGKAVSQNLLFPINVELSPDRVALYEEAREILEAAGFTAEPFGAGTVLLSGVPISLSRKSPEIVFHAILDDVDNMQKEGADLKKAVAQSMACRAAVMAGDRLTSEEAVALYKQLMKCDNRHSCPHGRPIILEIAKEELDAKFGRK